MGAAILFTNILSGTSRSFNRITSDPDIVTPTESSEVVRINYGNSAEVFDKSRETAKRETEENYILALGIYLALESR